MSSPYAEIPVEHWPEITEALVHKHPLSTDELVDVVLVTWNGIFESRFGSKGFHIGKDIFPKPQIMGFLLHELIPLELQARYPRDWCGERDGADKDIVFVSEPFFSIEVKTSSHPTRVFGNRSYAQESSEGKKSKSGYYLTVNFQKCTSKTPSPKIVLVRFGWIDSSDWVGQAAATGQQAHLTPEAEKYKLKAIYTLPKKA